MNKRITIGLLLLTVIALIGIPQALAYQNPWLDAFNAKYGTLNTRLDSCSTCHVSGSFARNPYGTAFAANGHDFAAIEGMDSDGDGFTNIDEINALTFPGDRNDKPATGTSPATATVTFDVKDSLTNLAIQGASVVMDGSKLKTDNNGKAVFVNVANGDHKYTVSMRGYKRTSGIVTVNNADASQPVLLTPRRG